MNFSKILFAITSNQKIAGITLISTLLVSAGDGLFFYNKEQEECETREVSHLSPEDSAIILKPYLPKGFEIQHVVVGTVNDIYCTSFTTSKANYTAFPKDPKMEPFSKSFCFQTTIKEN